MPLSPSGSGRADDLGGAEGIEAVDECDADVDFGGLAVGVSRGDALAEGLEAAHLGLGAAAGVVSCPAFPERPAVVTCGAQGFVAGPGGWTVLLPRATVLADRDDRRAATRDDGAVATTGIVGAVRGHVADVLVLRDLAKQVRQDGAVAITQSTV